MHRRMVPRSLGPREAGSFGHATPVGKATSYRAGEGNEEESGMQSVPKQKQQHKQKYHGNKKLSTLNCMELNF